MRSFPFPQIALALVSVALAVALAEVGFRLAGHDFSGARAAREARPIYYRRPTVPVGSVFFRRPGPASWTGNVLSSGLRLAWPDIEDAQDPYRDDADVSIHYDREGFRNPEDLDRWQIAVSGDGITEQGALPYEDLFTTQLGRRLGVPVKNLGLSFAGPLAQIFLLEQYGASPELHHVLLVFFEGNDLDDLARELRELREWQRTGQRRERRVEVEVQSSLLRHLARRLFEEPRADPAAVPSFDSLKDRTGSFRSSSGELPVTFAYTPPDRRRLGAALASALDFALEDFARMARALGADPWLVYVPCKRRVLHGGRLRFGDGVDASLVAWRPNDLPDHVGESARRHGIRFLDVTGPLVAETRKGRLTYNPIWDTHLNREGSHVVGKALAAALATPDADRRSSDRQQAPPRPGPQ